MPGPAGVEVYGLRQYRDSGGTESWGMETRGYGDSGDMETRGMETQAHPISSQKSGLHFISQGAGVYS